MSGLVSALRRHAPSLRGLLPLATLLAAWQILGDDRSFSFPPPAKWLRSLAEMHEAGTLAPALVLQRQFGVS